MLFVTKTVGALVKEDRILQTVPNVTMALHLLCECFSHDSFWLPYLSILAFIVLLSSADYLFCCLISDW